jgi:hypothetical protein
VLLISTAATVINDHITAGIGVNVLQTEFAALAPADWPRSSGSIYTALCNLGLQIVGDWMEAHRPHDWIQYVLEAGHKFQHEADAVLRAIGSDGQFRRHCHYPLPSVPREIRCDRL